MQRLYLRLKKDYDRVLKHFCFSSKKCDLAEADLLCIKNDKIDVYEVKCSYRISKAKKQLKRIRRLLGFDNIDTYFYCGSADEVVAVDS